MFQTQFESMSKRKNTFAPAENATLMLVLIRLPLPADGNGSHLHHENNMPPNYISKRDFGLTLLPQTPLIKNTAKYPAAMNHGIALYLFLAQSLVRFKTFSDKKVTKGGISFRRWTIDH